jgi:hypothetical protein
VHLASKSPNGIQEQGRGIYLLMDIYMDIYQLQAERIRLIQAARRLRAHVQMTIWHQSAVLDRAKEALTHSRQQRTERLYRALKPQLPTVCDSAAGKHELPGVSDH